MADQRIAIPAAPDHATQMALHEAGIFVSVDLSVIPHRYELVAEQGIDVARVLNRVASQSKSFRSYKGAALPSHGNGARDIDAMTNAEFLEHLAILRVVRQACDGAGLYDFSTMTPVERAMRRSNPY